VTKELQSDTAIDESALNGASLPVRKMTAAFSPPYADISPEDSPVIAPSPVNTIENAGFHSLREWNVACVYLQM